jgi:hypothetical protein
LECDPHTDPAVPGIKENIMSMTRDEAIKHFALGRFDGKTIAQAFELAPPAVRNGLHPKDHNWIKRYADVPAWDACQRLHARGEANQEGVVDLACAA